MDYKEQIEQAKRAAVKWREKHPVIGVGEIRVDCMVDDLTRSITDLLARAEAAEAAQETLQRAVEEYKARAEKAERERDAAVKDLEKAMEFDYADNVFSYLCSICENHRYDGRCKLINGDCKPKWRGQKEE